MNELNWQLIELVLAVFIVLIVLVPVIIIRQGEKDGNFE
jgi:hypothetical protein